MDHVPATPIADLLHASRVLSNAGFLPATDGNLSVRLEHDRVLVTRSGIEKRDLTEDGLVAVSLATEQVPGASSEWLMHRAIYLARADVNSVLHVHSPYLTAFACTHRVPSVALLAEACAEVGKIAFVSYHGPGTADLAQAVRRAVHESDICVLANHGALAVGSSVRDALFKLERAEFLARVEWLAAALGGGMLLPEKEVVALGKREHDARSRD